MNHKYIELNQKKRKNTGQSSECSLSKLGLVLKQNNKKNDVYPICWPEKSFREGEHRKIRVLKLDQKFLIPKTAKEGEMQIGT